MYLGTLPLPPPPVAPLASAGEGSSSSSRYAAAARVTRFNVDHWSLGVKAPSFPRMLSAAGSTWPDKGPI